MEFVKQNINQPLPTQLPKWMIDEGIVPGAIIQDVKGIGSKDSKNKTDVIIHLSEGAPIKISAKLLNADYFGNWYGHISDLENNPGPYFKGSYSTIYMSRNRKKIGMNKVSLYKPVVVRHLNILEVNQWKK
ncbi:hypothetical protein [Streptococcus suis]